MKIACIGPMKPLRGGIAHSNEVMCANLSKNNVMTTVSFSRLFPKILYPGKKQESGSKKNLGTLDSIIPLIWLSERKKIEEQNPEAVIFQWWTTFLFPCYFTLSGIKQRKIAICQNIFPHSEGTFKFILNPLHEMLAKIFLARMDRLMAMSMEDQRKLKAIFPKKEIGLYLEPMYEVKGLEGKDLDREKAKQKLGLKGKNVLLFFGFVREYKGLEYLLRAMPEIAKKTDAQLLVVGEFWEKEEKYDSIIREMGIEKNVRIVDAYVPDEEVAGYFTAADLLVLPYLAISESGVIRMAFNFDLPILSTNVGGNPDHIQNGFNGFLVEPKDSNAIAEKTIEFFEKGLYKRLSQGMRAKRKELEWSAEKETQILGK